MSGIRCHDVISSFFFDAVALDHVNWPLYAALASRIGCRYDAKNRKRQLEFSARLASFLRRTISKIENRLVFPKFIFYCSNCLTIFELLYSLSCKPHRRKKRQPLLANLSSHPSSCSLRLGREGLGRRSLTVLISLCCLLFRTRPSGAKHTIPKRCERLREVAL